MAPPRDFGVRLAVWSYPPYKSTMHGIRRARAPEVQNVLGQLFIDFCVPSAQALKI